MFYFFLFKFIWIFNFSQKNKLESKNKKEFDWLDELYVLDKQNGLVSTKDFKKDSNVAIGHYISKGPSNGSPVFRGPRGGYFIFQLEDKNKKKSHPNKDTISKFR